MLVPITTVVPGSVDVVTTPGPSLLIDSLPLDNVVVTTGNIVVVVVTDGSKAAGVDVVTLTIPVGVTLGSSTQLSGTVIGTQSVICIIIFYATLVEGGTFGDAFRCGVFHTGWYLNGGCVQFVYHSDS